MKRSDLTNLTSPRKAGLFAEICRDDKEYIQSILPSIQGQLGILTTIMYAQLVEDLKDLNIFTFNPENLELVTAHVKTKYPKAFLNTNASTAYTADGNSLRRGTVSPDGAYTEPSTEPSSVQETDGVGRDPTGGGPEKVSS